MIDFNNLTSEQREFFNRAWEQHQSELQAQADAATHLNTFLANRREQDARGEAAAQELRKRMTGQGHMDNQHRFV